MKSIRNTMGWLALTVIVVARPALADTTSAPDASSAVMSTKAALGTRYNIKDFHDAGLNCGRVPLDVLDGVIDRYIATVKV